MNNNLPLANPVNPTSITSNPQILLANRAHRTLVRSRQTRDRYRLLPEGYQVTPGRNRHPGTMVGNTPVLWIPELSGTSDPDRGFWAKLEGFNPGGMKDRPALYMVECARARGDIAPGAAIVESTSGTLGLGLALAGKVYRHPVTLVTDPGLEPIIARMLTAYGAGVDMVTQPHPVGGWQQARKDRVAQLMAEYPGAWNPNQYGNPDNVGAYRSLALELVAQLGRIDVLVCSVGTGGHSAGVARVLREFNPDMRLIGVDTIGSTIFGQPASNRLMRGLGSSIYPRNVDYRAFDEVHWVAPPEAVWACRSLAATQLRQRRLERRGGRPGSRLGSTQLAGGHHDCRGLSRRPTTLLRHHLQRRVLQRTRTARRTTSHRARRDCLAARRRRHPMDTQHHGDRSNPGGVVMGARAIFRGFNRPSRVLMINQFGINIGFYMLMPYLADYLAGPLGLAAWAVGLVMGVRNFSQQGMFFVGGTLADRFGYKPLIIAGCLIRTGGFALLVVAQSLPSVLIAAAATGFAGALFNPAVRGYLAAEAGERKIEAFAMFNVFYQSGILLGPLVGLVLLALDFRITVLAAAGVFGLLTVAQLVALPQHRADSEREKTSILQDWRVVVRNRPFLTLAAAMTGCYALSFQIYLALPMQASILMPRNQYLLIAAMFAVSGLVAVGGQLRITRWFAVRWGAERSLVVGATILAASFIPVAVIPNGQRFGVAVAVMALVLSASLLAVASAALFPFEMRAVVALSGDRLVATHYGFYSTIVGVGVLVGNLAIGSLMSAARRLNTDEIVWGGLILVGIVAVAGLRRLDTFTSGSQNMTGRWAAPR